MPGPGEGGFASIFLGADYTQVAQRILNLKKDSAKRLCKTEVSLGVETVRSDLIVDKGVCEPQCESVKPISPVNLVMRRSRLCLKSQTATGKP